MCFFLSFSESFVTYKRKEKKNKKKKRQKKSKKEIETYRKFKLVVED